MKQPFIKAFEQTLTSLLIACLFVCMIPTANAAIIHSNPTFFNDQWNNGNSWQGGSVPTSSDTVIIDAGDTTRLTSFGNGAADTVLVEGTLKIEDNTLTVSNGLGIASAGVLTVSDGASCDAGQILEAMGTIRVQGTASLTSSASITLLDGALVEITSSDGNFSATGDITFQEGAYAKHFSNGTITAGGTISYEQSLGADNSRSWYLCPPLASPNQTDFGEQIFRWDETASTGWVSVTSNSGMQRSSTGYVHQSSGSISFTGKLQGEPITFDNMDFTDGADRPGWHLTGNPFPIPIDFDHIDKSEIKDSAYYMRSNSNSGDPDGTIYSYSQSTGSVVPGFPNNNPGNIIAPLQGFWVRVDDEATNGVLVYSRDVKVDPGTAPVLRKKPSTPSHLRVSVKGNDFMDQTALFYLPEAEETYGFADVTKFSYGDDEAGNLFFQSSDGEKLVQRSDAPPQLAEGETKNYQLHWMPNRAGSYTFEVPNFAHFPDTLNAFLIDKKTGDRQDLRQSNTYSFQSPTKDDADFMADRFLLEISNNPDIITGMKEQAQKSIEVYKRNNQLAVDLRQIPSNKRLQYQIVNVKGQEVQSGRLNGGRDHNLPLQLSEGQYVVKIQGEDWSETRKILW